MDLQKSAQGSLKRDFGVIRAVEVSFSKNHGFSQDITKREIRMGLTVFLLNLVVLVSDFRIFCAKLPLALRIIVQVRIRLI
jgi:hypothetical protein